MVLSKVPGIYLRIRSFITRQLSTIESSALNGIPSLWNLIGAFGGSASESNRASPRGQGATGFEDREGHRAPFASAVRL
jgi:hypothetical protein